MSESDLGFRAASRAAARCHRRRAGLDWKGGQVQSVSIALAQPTSVRPPAKSQAVARRPSRWLVLSEAMAPTRRPADTKITAGTASKPPNPANRAATTIANAPRIAAGTGPTPGVGRNRTRFGRAMCRRAKLISTCAMSLTNQLMVNCWKHSAVRESASQLHQLRFFACRRKSWRISTRSARRVTNYVIIRC